ncbi:MAG TPA: tRNA(Ile)(2)-agmatinylcytidine synthase [Candidatus Bathyarchaeia archaeon]|nr:tRNA(Ile)(2)-agmatinylcytidine synthase [Candidatus Bathyarchaeia archaeon]
MITLHIGIDDTDSPQAGCTTYVASLLVERLHALGVLFIDYPNLVRLNPNVPWKTRGNGALCLRVRCDEAQVEDIVEVVVDAVETNSDLSHAGTEPGLVLLPGEKISVELTAFAKKAIQGIVKMKNALNLISEYKAEAVGFKTGRGIIGALAAVGETLAEDHTFELIAYRVPANYGTRRRVDADSVFKMNEKTEPFTFNNIDSEKRRILISPHGPDPILYGIRGQTANIVKKAHQMVRCFEPVERWTVFRTNHGTDAHLRQVASIKDIRAYHPVVVKGAVSKPPWIVPRRHVVFTIKDATGQIDCAAYEPTGGLRRKASELIVGDAIEACGGVRSGSRTGPMTVNLEKFQVTRLEPKLAFMNPLCLRCGKRMKSMGAGQGFRCGRCGFRSVKVKKHMTEIKRGLESELYVTSPRSQRHLTKPLSRYGMENMHKPRRMVLQWFWVNKNPNLVP